MHMFGWGKRRANRVALAVVVWTAGCFEDSQPVVDDDDDSAASTSAGESATGGATLPPTTDVPSSTSGPGTATVTVTDSTTSVTSVGDDSGTTDMDVTTDSSPTVTDTADDTTGEPTTDLCGFTDGFGDGEFDPLWSLEHPLSIDEDQGHAVIRLTAADGDEYPRLEVTPDDGFAGRRVLIRTGALPPEFGTQLNLYVAASAGDMLLVSLNYTAELQFEVQQQGGKGGDQTHYSEPYAGVGAPWIRLSENMGTMSVESSDDGRSFLPVTNFPTPFPMAEVSVGVAGNNWEELPGGPVHVSIDSFAFECPASP